MADVVLKRIYADESPDDGQRVLVDRIWPRGVSKERADLTEWCKDVAPTTELRKWYGHDPENYDEFARRYEAELKDGPQAEGFAHLKSLAGKGKLTLLTATKDADISEAAVLVKLLS